MTPSAPARRLLALLPLLLALPTSAAQESDEKEDAKPGRSKVETAVRGLKMRSIGPALMSGRIADLAIDPVKPNTWYVAVGSGGVWKTVNAGTTWTPIFDDHGSYSIGCVTIDPSDRHTIWVGTGEAVGGRHVGFGDGVYRSRDGGKSFENVGLKESEHVAKIVVDPRDPDVVWVAAQGPLWSSGGERGLYRTTDGGETWTRHLAAGPYTGVTDVAIDPRDPDVVYAATHQRHRTVAALIDGGPESGIHKSTDGGATWRRLKRGLPSGDVGKIALAVSPQRPDVVYATIELPGGEGGFWRSSDRGESWEKKSDYVSGGTGPHYYQELWADPHRFDVLYQANVVLGRTEDGGATWEGLRREGKHVDNHAVAFHPTDPDFLLVGCDGGLYRSYDRAETYAYTANLPLTQFYKVDVDDDWPVYHVVGGTQDNNTQYGPARTLTRNGIRNADWRITIGGDGHDCAIDPVDPDIVYCESQQGYLRRFDRRTGESVDIRPQPGPGEENFRFNWDSPIHISPHSHTRLYFGSKILHRSDDRGDSWTSVSGDLSRGLDRLTMPMMGRVWSIDAIWDLRAMSKFGNVTSISESPLVEGLIYVGTDDGLVQVTEDGGGSWRRVDRIEGVPEFAFVNDVKADRHDADTVYAALDHHKTGDFAPYLVKSTDRGRTWASIAGDLPDRHLVWRVIQDHVDPDLLFAGTEFGAFVTVDGGGSWTKLAGAPTIPFRDLEIQRRENDLVGATFGRSFWVLDDYSPLRFLDEESLVTAEFRLFPVRKALLYVEDDRLGGERGSQGDAYHVAENPPFGAVFTCWLRDGLKTRRAARREAEKEVAKEGGDTPRPDWDELEREEREAAPTVVLEILDASGAVVDRIAGPTKAGLH
ncbi:MAG: WD40/YVTN/BNR-like repeat-containing protein, partial [Planctomycetota bacterium JB042]